MATLKNPLSAFAKSQTQNKLQIQKFPMLSDHLSKGFKEGSASYDQAVLEWVRNLEINLNDQLESKQFSTSVPASTPVSSG